MIHFSIKNEIKRAVCRPAFAAGVFLQIFLLWIGAWEDWGFRDQVDAFYLFALSRESAIFSLFAPIVVILPYIPVIASDWQRKTVYGHIYRSGTRPYIISRIAAAAVSGGMAMAMGTWLYGLACIYFSPADSFIVEVWRSYADNTWLESAFRSAGGREYIWLSIGLDGLTGIVWAGAGLLISLLFRHPLISLLGTQGVYLLFLRTPFLSKYYQPNTFFASGLGVRHSSLINLLLIQLLVITIIWLFTYVYILRSIRKLGVNLSKIDGYQHVFRVPSALRESDVWLLVLPLMLIRPFIFNAQAQSVPGVLLHGLGGFPFQEQSTVNDIAQWFLLIIPPLLIALISLQRELSGRLYLTLYRMKTERAWLRQQIKQQAVVCLVYTTVQAIILIGWGVVKGLSTGSAVVFLAEAGAKIVSFSSAFMVIPLLATHLMVLCLLLTFTLLILNNSVIAAVTTLIVSIASVWIVQVDRFRAFILGYTGMLLRSSLIEPNQFTPLVQILIQIVLIMLLILACYISVSYHKRFIHQKARSIND